MGPVDQLGDRPPCTREVAGSNPARSNLNQTACFLYYFFKNTISMTAYYFLKTVPINTIHLFKLVFQQPYNYCCQKSYIRTEPVCLSIKCIFSSLNFTHIVSPIEYLSPTSPNALSITSSSSK